MTRRLIVQEFMALDGVMKAPGFEEHRDGNGAVQIAFAGLVMGLAVGAIAVALPV